MKIILIVVLFQLILLFNLCCAYMPVYHVANQDLLKGILLGALLTQHKYPPHFLNVMPMPYYNNYVSSQQQQQQQQPYAYPNPTPSVEHNHPMQNSNYRERPTEPSNDSPQQMRGQQQENESQQEQTSHSQPQPQHHQPEDYHQHQHQQYQHQNRHQQSESLYEPVVTDPPSNQPNQLPPQMPQRSEPVIPSLDTIQKNLGFPGHSVILMILPSFDTNKEHQKQLVSNETKEPNRTEIAERDRNSQIEPEPTEQEQLSSEEQMVSDYDDSIKTNAIKIGSKHLNAKGWKPVPKATTATTTTTSTTESSAQQEYNDRFNRYHMNKYIERSQFGLRNKDLNQLNRDLNQYYSIDQIHD